MPSHLVRVNRLLYQISQLVQINDVQALLSDRQANAWAEACALQLRLAWVLYLRELADAYGLRNAPAIHSLNDLVKNLRTENKPLAEVEELLSLAQQQDSWLCECLAFVKNLEVSDVLPAIAKAFSSAEVDGDLIAIVDLENETAETLKINVSVISRWLSEFKMLIQRQRLTINEF